MGLINLCVSMKIFSLLVSHLYVLPDWNLGWFPFYYKCGYLIFIFWIWSRVLLILRSSLLYFLKKMLVMGKQLMFTAKLVEDVVQLLFFVTWFENKLYLSFYLYKTNHASNYRLVKCFYLCRCSINRWHLSQLMSTSNWGGQESI